MDSKKTNNTIVQNSKLWEMLVMLNEEERENLVAYVRSHFHNSSTAALEMLNVLIEMLASDAIVSKSSFAEQLKMTIDETNSWMCKLLRAVEGFLDSQEKNTANAEGAMRLLLAFKKQGMKKNAAGQSHKVERMLNKTKPQQVAYSEKHLNVLFYNYAQYSENNNQNKSIEQLLNKRHDSLDAFYVEQKLRACIEYLNIKTIRTVEDENWKIDAEIALLAAKKFPNHLPIQLQSWAYEMFASDDDWETYYNKIETEISTSSKDWADDLLKEASLYLMNRATKAINEGKLDYAPKYLSVVNNLIDRDLILDDNILPDNRYVTIVYAGLLANESKWLKKFIKKYSKHLDKINKEAVEHLNLAHVRFVEGEYEAAREELFLIPKKDRTFKYDIYHKLFYDKLLIRTYFELRDDASFSRKRTFFKIWIGDQKTIPTARKQVYFNFLDAITKIYHTANLAEQQKLIKEALSGDITIFDRIWLEKKLEGEEKTPPPCNK